MIKRPEEIIRNLQSCIRNPKCCRDCNMERKGGDSYCQRNLMELALFHIVFLHDQFEIHPEAFQEPAQAPEPWTREKVLAEAKRCVCGERDQSYGGPEDSFLRIANLWTAYHGAEFTPVDVAVMMSLLKVARLASNPQHMDSWVDLAGYAACGGEIAGKEVQE